MVKLFKIESTGVASKLRRLIAAGGAAIEGPFDGEEAITLLADLDAGATGSMTSALISGSKSATIRFRTSLDANVGPTRGREGEFVGTPGND